MSDREDNLPLLYQGETKQVRATYKGNPQAIRQWLDARFKAMSTARAPFEPLWIDIRDHIEPTIGRALDAGDSNVSEGKRKDERIKTSFVRDLAHQYADGMQSGVTNPSNSWFEFVQERNGTKVKESRSLKAWFDFITGQVSRCMQRSNVYRVTREVYLHAGVFGTACALLLRGARPGSVFLHLIDEGDYWISEDPYQRVDTLIRRMRLTISQAVSEFGITSIPDQWARLYEAGQNEEVVTVYQLICPNDPKSPLFRDVNSNAPMATFYWCDADRGNADNNGILRISQFTYNPIVAYRQSHSFTSPYGFGLGEKGLPDIKQLYFMETVKAKLMGNEVDPPILAPSSMKGKPINMFPGGVTYVDNVSAIGGSPIGRMFQTNINPQVAMAILEDLHQRIIKLWHGDLFGLMINISQGKKDMTAREVDVLNGEKIALLGPVLTGMNDDFLTPLTDAIFTVLYEDGYLEDEDHEVPEECMPDQDNGGQPEVSIGTEFVSTIHTESLANLKMRGSLKLMDIVGMLAQANPEVIDKIDTDQVVDDVADIYRTTASFVRTDEQVQEIRAVRQKQIQQAQQQQAMAEMARSAGTQAKALSEADMNNGSLLDAMTGGQNE